MTEPIPESPVPYGGCLWPVDPACLTAEWDEADPLLRDRALALASATLRRLTAYRVGGCPVTVRPCSPKCWIPSFVPFQGSYGAAWMQPGMNVAGNWINGCGCSGNCGCKTACEISLPAPVGRVDEVKVDGNIIASSDYRIDDGHILVWTGAGECPFPATQDLSLDDDQPGTFSITYLNAYPVDQLGAQAAAILALEFLKACKPDGKCTLPPTVTAIVRNGVSYTITPGAFPGGFTGLRLVDTFIALWNPDNRTSQPSVWSPDMPRMRRTN